MKARSLFAILFIVSLGHRIAEAADNASLTSEQILHHVSDRYSTLSSYRDTGIVTSTQESKEYPKDVSEQEFSTIFKRPEKLKLNYHKRYYSDQQAATLWIDGKSAKHKSWLKKDIEDTSPTFALAGEVGVSQGLASTIPALLERDWNIGAQQVLKMDHPERLRDEACGKNVCYKINDDANHRTLWIEQETFLIRRIETVTFLNSATQKELAEKLGQARDQSPPETRKQLDEALKLVENIPVPEATVTTTMQFEPQADQKVDDTEVAYSSTK